MSKHISIDFGTSNTVIAEENLGVVLNEPSLAAIDLKNGQLVAVGSDAKSLLGKAPKDIKVISPVKGGVVSDFDSAAAMLKVFIENTFPKGILRPKATICIPYGLTDVENRVMIECVARSNVKCDYTFDASIASLVGSDVDVEKPLGNMVLDIGGGKACATVVSFGGIVSATSYNCGGDKMDLSIIDYIKKNYGIKIGKKTAEEIKIKIGNCYGGSDTYLAVGRDEISGLPKEVSITCDDVSFAISSELKEIINLIKKTLENTPQELIYDITEHGICLLGGVSKLSGLDRYIEENIGIKTNISKIPFESAAVGACAFFKKGISR